MTHPRQRGWHSCGLHSSYKYYHHHYHFYQPKGSHYKPSNGILLQDMQEMGPPCPFSVQSSPHPSPKKSDLGNDDCNCDRQRVREEKMEQQWKQEEKNNKEKVPNNYYPAVEIMTLPINKIPCPVVVPKRNRPWTKLLPFKLCL